MQKLQYESVELAGTFGENDCGVSLMKRKVAMFLIMSFLLVSSIITSVQSLLGDIDGDGDVDRYDFGIFSGAYGAMFGDPEYVVEADLDGDGDVDRYDFGIFAENYGKSSTVTVVDVTVDSESLSSSLQKKGFYAEQMFWAFYSDKLGIQYKTRNGQVWSEKRELISCIGGQGYYFSLAYNGSHFSYVFGSFLENTGLRYRVGVPTSEGLVDWVAPEQLVVAPAVRVSCRVPSIALDSDNKPFISYLRYNHTSPTGTPYVTSSFESNGTWVTASEYPLQLTTVENNMWRTQMVNMSNGRMYAFYAMDFQTVKGRLYNGTDWSPEEECTTSTVQQRNAYSAVCVDDTVHLVFLKQPPPYDLVYTNRTSSGWGNETTVQTAVTYQSFPLLTQGLHVFWTDSPTEDCIFYKKFSSGVWGNLTLFSDESESGLLRVSGIATGMPTIYSHGILFMVNDSATSWKIKHGVLEAHN